MSLLTQVTLGILVSAFYDFLNHETNKLRASNSYDNFNFLRQMRYKRSIKKIFICSTLKC
jgi:hypothetical protein